ncbi:hypothetical protein AMS68_000031 [Peltaster fructicola]|uniref:Uncharacterized protein n=1 Tax=Peltaster fructicola TaxID=286661 RepID=A0A6H0XIH6_9PEZI|nr:hypothetical protein AMS68_000031 [Peltaster fructicola]
MASDDLAVPKGNSQLHHYVSKDNTQHIISEETSSRVSGVSDHEDQLDRAPFIAVSPIQQSHGPTFTPGRTTEKPKPRSQKLTTSYIPLLAVLGYIGLFLFAWIVLCLLAYKPITTKSYGVLLSNDGSSDQDYRDGGYRTMYKQSERWFRAARVIHVVVAVLTLPVVSIACAAAAAVYVQRRGSKWTLRQTMALADRAWQSPTLAARALVSFKRYASVFLLMALALNALGLILLPLQSVFLSSRVIKTPNQLVTTGGVTDIFDAIDTGRRSAVVAARAAMASTNLYAPYSRLWTRSKISCSGTVQYDESTSTKTWMGLPCSGYGPTAPTFGNMSLLSDPFWAQLPASTSTGLIRQFSLRVNSTATKQVITAADFPAACSPSGNSFFATYSGNSPTINQDVPGTNYSVSACMPYNQGMSPWKATRARQDFYEELYLSFSLGRQSSGSDTGYYKIRVNTTAGYFELPNYMNGQVAGPLLANGPNGLCGPDCYEQGTSKNPIKNSSLLRRASPIVGNMSANSLTAEFKSNTGPLLMTAIAMFGNGSMLSTRALHPDSYSDNYTKVETGDLAGADLCYERIPFVPLLSRYTYMPDTCATLTNGDTGLFSQQYKMVDALYSSASAEDGGFENAFTVAAVLANEAYFTTTDTTGGLATGLTPSFSVSYDMGADTTIPAISKSTIIALSVLMAIFLAALLALAVYGTLYPVWTHQLDSWAMLRIGASLAESATLRAGDASKSSIPDETPGWIGDSTQGESQYGEVAVGGSGRLNKRRAYLSI